MKQPQITVCEWWKPIFSETWWVEFLYLHNWVDHEKLVWFLHIFFEWLIEEQSHILKKTVFIENLKLIWISFEFF